jgi:UDP-glucose 4-epimerase
MSTWGSVVTVLVTGSAGHLGEAIIRVLQRGGRGARGAALGIDRVTSNFTGRIGSITDRLFVRDAMREARAVIHTATLHKPHVDTYSWQSFVDTNITGTLVLLEEAAAAGVESFVFTSTTSAFGSALSPAAGRPAAWITEAVVPVVKNIYGATKVAAETLCELFQKDRGLPVVVLRVSRFFQEPDDDPNARARFSVGNAQANEFLHRRVDLQDAVDAHIAALERAPAIGFGRYIVSATSPFMPADLAQLRADAEPVIRRLYPDYAALYAARGWTMVRQIDRVYVNDAARRDLQWKPHHDFQHVLQSLSMDQDFRSPLAREVGSKSYHAMR